MWTHNCGNASLNVMYMLRHSSIHGIQLMITHAQRTCDSCRDCLCLTLLVIFVRKKDIRFLQGPLALRSSRSGTRFVLRFRLHSPRTDAVDVPFGMYVLFCCLMTKNNKSLVLLALKFLPECMSFFAVHKKGRRSTFCSAPTFSSLIFLDSMYHFYTLNLCILLCFHLFFKGLNTFYYKYNC